MSSIKLHNPSYFGEICIGSKQVEVLSIDVDEDIVEPEIVYIQNNKVVKRMTEGDGLTLSNSDRTVSWSLDGSEFNSKLGVVRAEISLFQKGELELTAHIRVLETNLTKA